jgi:DNA polymerase sigma
MKIQKEAIRFCAAKLMTNTYGFKMKRAAFRGDDPKIVLLAPIQVGHEAVRVPMTFSVNAMSACQYRTLMCECGRFHACSQDLVLVVRRWALQRCIAWTDRGHLSQNAWSILVIHYLQTTSFMPPLDQGQGHAREMVRRHGSDSSVAALFQGFLQFYHERFDWSNGQVCVRSGSVGVRRVASQMCIVDPADRRRNLASSLTHDGLQRVKDELLRANELITRNGSFAELMSTWRHAEQLQADDTPDEA